jgi:hypothetical protein
VLYLDVSKVNQDVAHVSIVFQLYVLNVSTVLEYVAKGLSGCCKSKFSV